MKKVYYVAVLMACCLQMFGEKQKCEMHLSRLQGQFHNPSAEFRTTPLWVWNTDVTTTDIDRMLLELKEQGFGGALVHPRPGLVTEYLSPEWFSLWRYALQKGKELGLLTGIYDENSYPSGFAGGHVPSEMPESYNQGQCLLGELCHVAPRAGDCCLCVLRKGDEFVDITDRLADYQGKQGTFYVYRLGFYGSSSWTAGFPYVDLMAKGVTEKFIDVTMGAYERALGSELGKSVKLVFSDEPNIASPDGRHCRWTPDLFSTFHPIMPSARTCSGRGTTGNTTGPTSRRAPTIWLCMHGIRCRASICSSISTTTRRARLNSAT